MQDNSFSSLGISSFLVSRMEERKIAEPTEIQRLVLPRLLGGEKREKVIFRSATGTGKTFAYLLPILETFLKDGFSDFGGPGCVVCAPTYELCSQIKQEADFLLDGTALKTALLIGSAQMGRQIESLKKERPVLVVGNPGRLLNLADLNKLKFKALKFLVLDEGDRLVSDELLEETRDLVSGIVKRPPPDFTFVSCSATFSQKSREKLFSFFGQTGRSGQIDEADNGGKSAGAAAKNFEIIETKENILRDFVEHWAFFSEERQKLGVLRSFIAAFPAFRRKGKTKTGRALIFTARARQVGNIVSALQHFKLDAAGLWGDMDRRARKQALDNFRGGRIRFLVTSDLAARGLDITDLDCVVSLDTGEEADTYVHRAGRTARAGKRGVMVTIGGESELRRLVVIEKKLGIKVFPKELYGGKITAPE